MPQHPWSEGADQGSPESRKLATLGPSGEPRNSDGRRGQNRGNSKRSSTQTPGRGCVCAGAPEIRGTQAERTSEVGRVPDPPPPPPHPTPGAWKLRPAVWKREAVGGPPRAAPPVPRSPHSPARPSRAVAPQSGCISCTGSPATCRSACGP